jgi:tRNA pseudouridine13 synthase
MDLPSILTEAPLRLTRHLPGVGGVFKQELEDFVVEEVPAYLPSGSGEHLFLWIEKRDMGAEYFQRQIAQRLGIPVGEIGTAGMKDRRAVTRQWVSVPVRCEAQLSQLESPDLKVLEVSKHNNKLRPGHLRGNRFTITLRNVHDPKVLPALLFEVQQQGLPNYYGTQRFGRELETLHLGWRMLHGERVKVNPFIRKLALSAVQSALFNHYLSKRLEDGLFRTVLTGDVMAKWPVGGLFVTQDVATEQQRLEAREIVPTGPMFGSRMKAAEGDATVRELAVLAAAGLTLEQFNAGGKLLEGTRRHNIIYVEELQCSVQEVNVTLKFQLPAGCYATVLLDEIMKTAVPVADGD